MNRILGTSLVVKIGVITTGQIHGEFERLIQEQIRGKAVKS